MQRDRESPEGGTPGHPLLENALKLASHLSRVNIYSFEIYRMTVHLTVYRQKWCASAY